MGEGTEYYIMPLMVAVLLWRAHPEMADLVKKCDDLIPVVRQAWQDRIVERERKKREAAND